MRPYLAEVTSTTCPGWQEALNVSQLQYSLTKPEWEMVPYCKISSEQPVAWRVLVSGSIDLMMQRPNLIRPYLAEVIRTTSPGLGQFAENVSQLQYSLTKPVRCKCLTL